MTEDDQGNEYFYDLDNRINKIEMANGTEIELSYDAMSRRIVSGDTLYLWWGDQEIAEHEATGQKNVIQNDIWAYPSALNQIIARAVVTTTQSQATEVQYYHKNYLDHVYAVSDDQGDLLEVYRYTAFGEVEIFDPNTLNKITSSAIDNPVLWNSRRFDEQTQLYYYKYRHYKANIGRWLGRDPIEEDGGYNLYAFVGNQPTNTWDFLGQLSFSDLVNPCNLPDNTNDTIAFSAVVPAAPDLTIKIKKTNINNNSRNFTISLTFELEWDVSKRVARLVVTPIPWQWARKKAYRLIRTYAPSVSAGLHGNVTADVCNCNYVGDVELMIGVFAAANFNVGFVVGRGKLTGDLFWDIDEGRFLPEKSGVYFEGRVSVKTRFYRKNWDLPRKQIW